MSIEILKETGALLEGHFLLSSGRHSDRYAQNAKLLWNDDGTPTARTGKILAGTPMGRFGETEELIGATLFLMSEEASGFVDGVVIPIDGGYAAYSGV